MGETTAWSGQATLQGVRLTWASVKDPGRWRTPGPSPGLGPAEEQVWEDVNELSFVSLRARGLGLQIYHMEIQDTQLNVNSRYTMYRFSISMSQIL